ncbi:MAG: uracil-DNA glycosylase [Fretibacterium sp.]|uniref:uracil-DNA glycosylase n=1 Tax=Fretibacterium sp. OH1220_COT-178 TaxID=2491047 RepID=UPI000F5ED14C|nr:uracil-DNA glycosylase [Fretibacterium sp. OH1220_COT-178]MDO4786576.1 uracil-DNA glycosylase [Fretibacterium sp.]RRD64762.1 uracil-DNA glycosylase [Fretibacterium sp. OH1220_COT-178]
MDGVEGELRVPSGREEAAWNELRSRVESCGRCGLCETRTRTVFGQGALRTPLAFVGEGPGADEDREGLAFVGRAGQLLTQILNAAGIDRESVFITNVVKCRPPNNRVPTQEEMMRCGDFLEAQLLLLRPRLLVCLGNTPMRWILKTSEGITALRGRWFEWRGIEVMPMFHPSYLLRNDSRQKGSPKDLTWQDVQKLKARLDEIRKENVERS